QPARPTEVTLASLRQGIPSSASGSAGGRRDRILAELVAPGGHAADAAGELTALRRELPRDPRVSLAASLVATAHGDFEHAAENLATTLDLARTSDDPLSGAIAEIAIDRIVQLREYVPDFARILQPKIAAIAQDPGHLGASAVVRVLDTAIRWARERGSETDESAWVHASGCVTEWTIAGAFGPLPMVRFDETLPPESPEPLAHD